MKITDLARLFDRDPELINDENLKRLEDWAMSNVAVWTMKRHANNPLQKKSFADAVTKFDAYAEESIRRSQIEIAARKASA